jgi:hypothetical protein
MSFHVDSSRFSSLVSLDEVESDLSKESTSVLLEEGSSSVVSFKLSLEGSFSSLLSFKVEDSFMGRASRT